MGHDVRRCKQCTSVIFVCGFYAITIVSTIACHVSCLALYYWLCFYIMEA